MRYFLLNEKDQDEIFSAVRSLNITLLELFIKKEILTESVEKEVVKMKARSKRERKYQMEYAMKKQNEEKKLLDQEYDNIIF